MTTEDQTTAAEAVAADIVVDPARAAVGDLLALGDGWWLYRLEDGHEQRVVAPGLICTRVQDGTPTWEHAGYGPDGDVVPWYDDAGYVRTEYVPEVAA